MKQQKTITQQFEKYGGTGWPPEDAAGFIAWFQARLDDVPLEYRATAQISIDAFVEYDSEYPRIEIEYTRPETDEEAAERERQQAEREDIVRARELRLLEELSKKYRKD